VRAEELSNPKLIVRLDHIQLAMPEGQEKAAELFYCGVLGFTRIPKPSNLEQRGGCWFERQGVVVHLGVDSCFVPARKAHPAFVVTSLEKMKSVLETAGCCVGNCRL
jgi:hypothetical protein